LKKKGWCKLQTKARVDQNNHSIIEANPGQLADYSRRQRKKLFGFFVRSDYEGDPGKSQTRSFVNELLKKMLAG